MSSWFPRELPNPITVSNQKLKEIPLPVLFSVYVCVGWGLGGILIRVTLAGFLNYQRKKSSSIYELSRILCESSCIQRWNSFFNHFTNTCKILSINQFSREFFCRIVLPTFSIKNLAPLFFFARSSTIQCPSLCHKNLWQSVCTHTECLKEEVLKNVWEMSTSVSY